MDTYVEGDVLYKVEEEGRGSLKSLVVVKYIVVRVISGRMFQGDHSFVTLWNNRNDRTNLGSESPAERIYEEGYRKTKSEAYKAYAVRKNQEINSWNQIHLQLILDAEKEAVRLEEEGE